MHALFAEVPDDERVTRGNMRRLLVTLALVVAGFALARAHAAGSGAPDIFPAVPEVRAVDGVARLDLYAVLDPSTGLPTIEYEAEPGIVPTIRVRPGDTIALDLHNDMPPEAHQANAINLHFHGLQVAPSIGQDDVLQTLAHRGGIIRYRVKIPRDHEPGLYWYHPHAHGESFRQVSAGISGAIVVEGLQQHLPALATMRERILILRDVPTGRDIFDEDMPIAGMAGQRAKSFARAANNGSNPCRAEKGMWTTMNRQPLGSIGMGAGERQFFRVVNASGGRIYDVSLDGIPLQVVAFDGVPLDALRGNPTSRTVQHLVIPPGGRAEFVVTGTGRPTVLRTACFDSGKTGDPDPAAIIANIVPTPEIASGANAATRSGNHDLAIGAPLPNNFFARPLPAPAARRTIRFTEDGNGFSFDGKAYDMSAPASIVAHAGTVERWTLDNTTDEVHDFHIHQVHFVVERVGGRAPGEREWLDTIDLAPHSKTDVTIDFRNPIVRGTFLYHCHILDHEDLGMMAKIAVR